MALKGGCLCGFVRYQVDAVPIDETNCHCTMCRRASGAPFVAWFTVPKTAVRWVTGTPSSFASSAHATRAFCPRCGTPLTFSSLQSPDEIDLTTASLDEPSQVPPRDDTYVASKLPWVVLDPNLPKYQGRRSAG
jgi:hypothetical protein